MLYRRNITPIPTYVILVSEMQIDDSVFNENGNQYKEMYYVQLIFWPKFERILIKYIGFFEVTNLIGLVRLNVFWICTTTKLA